MRNITLKEIAALADVSVGTVSRVVNNTGDGYSEETYRRVKEIVDQYGYVPNRIAKALIAKQTKTIGLVMMNIMNPFFPELARGIEKRALEEKFSILLCNSDDNPLTERDHLQLLQEKQVDGIILTTASLWENPNIDSLVHTKFPFVIIDADSAGSCYYNVSVDHYGGAKTIVNYLIAMGHKQIACITGPSTSESTKLRFSGYKHALAAHQIPIRKELVTEGNYHAESVPAAMDRLEGTGYTAIFSCNDLMAVGVYQYLNRKGQRIPEDVSVVGFDDISFAAMMHPPLTTMHQPAFDMGGGAVELLIRAMETEEGAPPETLSRSYGLDLIVRGSVRNLNHKLV